MQYCIHIQSQIFHLIAFPDHLPEMQQYESRVGNIPIPDVKSVNQIQGMICNKEVRCFFPVFHNPAVGCRLGTDSHQFQVEGRNPVVVGYKSSDLLVAVISPVAAIKIKQCPFLVGD